MLKRLYFGLLFMTAIGTFAAQAQTDDSAGVGPSAHYHYKGAALFDQSNETQTDRLDHRREY